MRTETRRWWGWSAAGALALTLGAPGLASAQQGGLFPNAGIQRERVPCQNEDPIYRLYRHEYFGYHPTCWRRFPDGWGCPSPEAPNAAAEFQKLPRDKPPELGPDDLGPGPDEGEMPAPRTGGEGRGPARPAPNALPPLPSGERNPFDLDSRPDTPPARNPSAPDGLPSLPAPGDDTPPPGTAPSPADASPTAPGASLAPVESQPLLALPDPTVNPSSGGNAPQVTGFPLPNGETPLPPPMPTTAPAQAPRRTGMLGNLFSGRIFRR